MSYAVISANENNINKNHNSFEYTYSSKRQKEIEDIRKKYIPKEEDKMETLRKLDKSAEKPGTIWSLVVGIIGAIIMGAGMSCALVGDTTILLIVGSIVGIIGMLIMSVAYPVYRIVTKKQREKIAGQILALTDELSL